MPTAALTIYLPDDTTTLASAGLALSGNAGEESSESVYHIWNSQGGGTAITGVRLRVRAKETSSSTWLRSGLPPLDERWIQARIDGGGNPGNDPAYVPFSSSYQGLGTNAALVIPDMPANTYYVLRVKVMVPMTAGPANVQYDIELDPAFSESAEDLAAGLAEKGQGILPGIGDVTVSEWVTAPLVQKSSVADDYVHINGLSHGVLRGISRRWFTWSHQFTQNDGASSALTSGQAYKAVITQGAGSAPTVTLGLRATAASAVAPTPPTGELMVAVVTVRYSATTTVIQATDIVNLAAHGRFFAEASGGFVVKVYGGRAIIAGGLVRRTSTQNATVGASTTSYIWLTAGGGLYVSTTLTPPPRTGLIPLWQVTADGSGVTALVDLRPKLRPGAIVLTVARRGYEPDEVILEAEAQEYVTVAASAYTDTGTLIPAGAQVLSVQTKWAVQPPDTSTAAIGVSGDTARYEAAVATTVGSKGAGLADGAPRFYASSSAIRITPDVTPADNTGRVLVRVTYRLAVSASASNIATLRAVAPFDWNLDEIIASVRTAASGGATGSLKLSPYAGSTKLCPDGGSSPETYAEIPAGSTVATNCWPTVTSGAAGDQFSFRVPTVTAGGTQASDIALAFVLYPLSAAG